MIGGYHLSLYISFTFLKSKKITLTDRTNDYLYKSLVTDGYAVHEYRCRLCRQLDGFVYLVFK